MSLLLTANILIRSMNNKKLSDSSVLLKVFQNAGILAV